MEEQVIPQGTVRKILHADFDAFFASVEQRDDASLRGRPVAVGGSRERGVVAAASYEARKFGVHSAMASVTARRLCPELVFVKPRFDVYREVSGQMHAIFSRFTSIIQPLSLDEAYLDVTEAAALRGSATVIAQDIRALVKQETGLTLSVGVSYNKFLAKLASGHRKPDGLFVITPKMGPAFVETLPVAKFHGVGPVTAARMNELGIFTGADLRERTRAFLTANFGKAGDYYYGIARAHDERPVDTDRRRKSLGAETTFERDLFDWDDVGPAITPVFSKVWEHYSRGEMAARTVTVKVKFSDFTQITRSRSPGVVIDTREAIEEIGYGLLRPLFPPDKGIRLLGVTLGNLDAPPAPAPGQMALEF